MFFDLVFSHYNLVGASIVNNEVKTGFPDDLKTVELEKDSFHRRETAERVYKLFSTLVFNVLWLALHGSLCLAVYLWAVWMSLSWSLLFFRGYRLPRPSPHYLNKLSAKLSMLS